MPPSFAEIDKATMLASVNESPVIIAIGAPWFDSPYISVTEDSYQEMRGPFASLPGAIEGYYAARGARFEFGETPRPQRLFA